MKLITDFVDYYDKEFNESSGFDIYERKLSMNMNRFDALEFIRNLGYKTIEIKPVKSVLTEPSVLVYTDHTKHNGQGKQIMSLSNAKMMYSSKPCAKVYEHLRTYKMLQIGDTFFSLTIVNNGLYEEHIESFEELGKTPNSVLRQYPMYSIDFVKDSNGEMLACDFDCVVELSHIKNIKNYLPAERIVELLGKVLRTGV